MFINDRFNLIFYLFVKVFIIKFSLIVCGFTVYDLVKVPLI